MHFSGNISNEYALETLKQIKLVEILANASVELEEELDVLFEQLEEFKRNQESEQELQTQKSNIPDDPEESLIGKKKKLEITWCKLTQIYMKGTIKILLPREYISRECSQRYVAADYLLI